jgi:DnaA family protein
MSAQIPLALRWPAHQRFTGFVAGANGVALELVQNAARGDDSAWLYLSGAQGSGRTHLLVAACAAASAGGRRAQYLPLSALRGARAQAIRGFGGSELLAIDDLDAIAGDRDAEHALFDLYNRCRAERATLLFAASAPAAQLGITLPDLVSRLSACTQVTLKPLDEGNAARSCATARLTVASTSTTRRSTGCSRAASATSPRCSTCSTASTAPRSRRNGA